MFLTTKRIPQEQLRFLRNLDDRVFFEPESRVIAVFFPDLSLMKASGLQTSVLFMSETPAVLRVLHCSEGQSTAADVLQLVVSGESNCGCRQWSHFWCSRG